MRKRSVCPRVSVPVFPVFRPRVSSPCFCPRVSRPRVSRPRVSHEQAKREWAKKRRGKPVAHVDKFEHDDVHDKIMLEDLAKMGLGDEELAKG
jgi:hypothetical protein